MRIHLTTTSSARLGNRFTVEYIAIEKIQGTLLSYAYSQMESVFATIWNIPENKHVIIDSGAFTAHSTGKTIHLKEYAEWALEFEKRWQHKITSLEFMNLDVIGDQEGSQRNLHRLEALGLRPLPIFTYRADLNILDELLASYDYIALGGLFDKPNLKTWLDACFARVMAYRRKTGTMRRIHLLGVTTDWVLKRYPCFTADSSSWTQGLRFSGGVKRWLKHGNINASKLPTPSQGDTAINANIHLMRIDIRRYKKMQDEATALWTKRGIIWND